MSCFKIICLICDGQGSLRRLRPEKIYVCQSCVSTHGGTGLILATLDEWKQKFIARHQETVFIKEGPLERRPKIVVIE